MKLTIFDPRIIRMTEVCNAFLDDGSVFFQSDYSYFPRFYIFGVVCAVDTNTHTHTHLAWLIEMLLIAFSEDRPTKDMEVV